MVEEVRAFGGDGVGVALAGGASAVLAASIFHFGEVRIGEAKAAMAKAGLPVRLPEEIPA